MRVSDRMCRSCPPNPRVSSSGCAAITATRGGREESNGFAVAVEGSDIYVPLACTHANRFAALLEPGIDQRADIFIAPAPRAPEVEQLVEQAAGHAESAPDPVRSGVK